MSDSKPSGTGDRSCLWVPDPRVLVVLLLWLACSLAIFFHADSPSSVTDEIIDQLSAGNAPNWKLDAVLGIYWGAVANIAIVVTLLGTMRWWAGARAQRAEIPVPARPGKPSRAFHVALMGLVILAGALRWNLAHGSFWWDELWNTKMATVGEFRTGSKHPDEQRFYPTDFARCAWYYQKPTNHPPTALASKVMHEMWARFTGAKEGTFNEFVIRLPVFLSALGSVMLVGLCARRWIGSGPGLLAAFLLAVNPWFIRYGIDARAYGPVVFFTLVALMSLDRAISANRWRHWALFGLAQFFLTWSHLHSIWFCGAMTCAAAWLLWRAGDPSSLVPRLTRLIAVNALAAGAFLQVFMPNLIQLWRWAGGENIDGSLLDFEMARSMASLFLFGIEPAWQAQSPETDGLVSWQSLTSGHLEFMWVCIAVASGLVVTGLSLLRRTNKQALALVLAIFAGAIVFEISAIAAGLYFYPRFAIALLPAIIIAAAAGCWQSAAWLNRNTSDGARSFVAAGWAAAYLLLCLPQIRLLQNRSYAPMREVAEFLNERKTVEGEIVAFGYGLGGRILKGYYPEVEFALHPPADEALQDALDRAATTRTPFYVFYGYPIFNRLVLPEGFRLLDDPAIFAEVAAFGGIEPAFYFRVLRARQPDEP